MGKVALVAGATGLIGNQLLNLLLSDDYYSKIIAISRKELPVRHERLQNIISELDQLALHADQLKAEDVYCCLGTTIRKAKTKEAFLKVDVEAPLALAAIAHSKGAKHFMLVSALGADPRSSIFYNRAKGEVEERLKKVGFESLYFFRPSLLLGPRLEKRSGEDAAKLFYRWLGFLIPKKYQAIESIKVARAMIANAKAAKPGNHILESSELQAY